MIIRKLEYFKEGGSEKHLRDIRGMLDVSGESMDRVELEAMIQRRDLREAWDKVQDLRLL